VRSTTLCVYFVFRVDSDRCYSFLIVSYFPNTSSFRDRCLKRAYKCIAFFLVYNFFDTISVLVVGILRLSQELAYSWGQKLSAVSSKR
jgi:hypothetical protein